MPSQYSATLTYVPTGQHYRHKTPQKGLDKRPLRCARAPLRNVGARETARGAKTESSSPAASRALAQAVLTVRSDRKVQRASTARGPRVRYVAASFGAQHSRFERRLSRHEGRDWRPTLQRPTLRMHGRAPAWHFKSESIQEQVGQVGATPERHVSIWSGVGG